MLKKILKSILPSNLIYFLSSLKDDYFTRWFLKSYSQEGEDMILRRIFEKQAQGFYVDIGAHHPKRFSNTFYFYQNGWCGINIDAMPGSMKSFDKIRPRDINIEIPISIKKEVLTFYIFNEPALNSFSKNLSELRNDADNPYYITDTKNIETSSLEEILDKNLLSNQVIDFMSIDVEGLDFMVLKSNNFNKYKPKVILIEILVDSLEEILNSEITLFLAENSYRIYAKAKNTVIYMTEEFYRETQKYKV